MRQRLLQVMGVAATIAVVSFAMRTVAGQVGTGPGKAPAVNAKAGSAPRTVWGEPDLEGIWSRDADVPLQRPTKFGRQRVLHRPGHVPNSIGK